MQILTNLLRMPEVHADGGQHDGGSRRNDGFVCVEVSDTGIGLSRKNRRSFYQIFQGPGSLAPGGGRHWGWGS